jgi:DNA-binding transcriptional LysR family regulator
VELRHLRYFVAVAEEATFVAAARRLGVAQPALTRQVHALEKELDVELLERTPKGTRLTPAGEVTLASARHLLRQVDAAVERARGSGLGLAGRCVICAGVRALASGLIGHVVERVRSEYPGIELRITEGSLTGQMEALRAGDADIGVGVPASSAFPDLVSETVDNDIFDSAALATSHRLARRRRIELAELSGDTFLGYRSEILGDFTHRLHSEFARHGFVPAAVREYDHAFNVASAVEAGQGWTLFYGDGVGLLHLGITVVPFTDFRLPLPHALVRRADERRPVVFTVSNVIRTVLQEQRAERDGRHPVVSARPSHPVIAHERTEGIPASAALELRHLRYFCAVAEAGSFGRAAEQLDLTQPALSRQVADLERVVGVSLLERVPRGVSATAAGESFARSASRILDEVRALAGETQRARRGAIARCVVGSVPTTLARQMVTALLREVAAEVPELELVLDEVVTPEQPEALRSGRIDVGICHPSPLSASDERGVERSHLTNDLMNCALVARTNPLAEQRSISIHELETIPFIFPDRSFQPALYDMLFGLFDRLGFRPRVEQTYEGLRTIWQLVASGHGWAMGFSSQCSDAPAGTASIPIDELSIPWGLDLLVRGDESRALVLDVGDRLHRIGSALR